MRGVLDDAAGGSGRINCLDQRISCRSVRLLSDDAESVGGRCFFFFYGNGSIVFLHLPWEKHIDLCGQKKNVVLEIGLLCVLHLTRKKCRSTYNEF